MTYDPSPLGMRLAREAVTGYYADHSAEVDPKDVVLTTGTSEGYSYVFRLLCDAGDEVLAAQPSYPLFEFLGDLDDVRLRPYPLFYDFGWWIDLAELERRIGPRTKAILVVHPNNPTGHVTSAEERHRIEELCSRYRLALIVDEVFLDYPLGTLAQGTRLESFASGSHPVLTFVLSGMSKVAGLPQMKVAWVTTFGPDDVKAQAMKRLEVIADTFLSMNAPMQLALPTWMAGRHTMQGQILERLRTNLRLADVTGLEVMRVQAGWSAILRLPQWGGDLAVELLNEADVIVHPGTFYGMAKKGRVVVSLLGASSNFEQGVLQMQRWVAEKTKNR